jgi:hypothetical protein
MPDLPIAGLSTPLRVRLDFDAETIDLMIERLTAAKGGLDQDPGDAEAGLPGGSFNSFGTLQPVSRPVIHSIFNWFTARLL